jgi:hypothetical protein
MSYLVIYSPNEADSNDGRGFWNDKTGWGRLFEADLYKMEQAENKPIPKATGNDAKFVRFDEASKHAE